MPERNGSRTKSTASTVSPRARAGGADGAPGRSPSRSVLVAVLMVLNGHRAAAAIEHDQLVSVGGLESGAVERDRGRPERDLAAMQAQHEVERPRALHVMARHEQRAALGA